MWTENQKFDVHLLAFDIVSFSRNLDNPDGLFLDRTALIEAIKSTTLFPKMVHENGVFVQFLGDEFRVAFRSSLAQPNDVVAFAENVFGNLDKLGNNAPTIRGVMLPGVVAGKNFMGCQYLDGESVYEAADLLGSEAQEGELVSPKPFYGWDKSPREWKQRFSTRRIDASQQIRVEDNSNSHPFFILSCALPSNKPSSSATTLLLSVVRAALTQSLSEADRQSIVRCSISPNGIIVAFRDDGITNIEAFLNSLRPHAAGRTPGFSAAFSSGKMRLIDGERWLSASFEGGEAIITSRILAKLKSGQLAYTDRIKAHKDFGSGTKRAFSGKRGESFEAYLVD